MDDYVKRIFLSGALKFMILRELIKFQPLSGYRILINIREKIGDLDAGSFYHSLKSLENRDLVLKAETEKKGAYNYTLTEKGRNFYETYIRLFYAIGGRFEED